MAKKKKAKDDWMQGAVKKPGSFTAYCKKKGFDGVTDECISEAKASGDPTVKKRAVLAETFRKSAGKAKRRKK